MPDAVWPIGRHPPDSSRDRKEPPVSTSTVSFRHFISGSLAFAFLTHTWRAHGTPFPTTLTTTALDRSSSGRFAASACTTTAEGHPATRAGLLHLLHSTASGDLAFYIQPPSTFVFTPPRGKLSSRARSLHAPDAAGRAIGTATIRFGQHGRGALLMAAYGVGQRSVIPSDWQRLDHSVSAGWRST
jgi:hypothetical protein